MGYSVEEREKKRRWLNQSSFSSTSISLEKEFMTNLVWYVSELWNRFIMERAYFFLEKDVRLKRVNMRKRLKESVRSGLGDKIPIQERDRMETVL